MQIYNRIVVLVIAMGLSAPALAEIPFGPLNVSAHAQITSDYAFRGVTQTDRRFGARLNVRVEHDAGPFADVSGSRIMFTDGNNGVELNLAAGYASGLAFIPFLKYDVSVLTRRYLNIPDAGRFNYVEGAALIKYDPKIFMVSAGVNYAPNYFNKSGSAFHYSASGTLRVLGSMELSAQAGYHTIANPGAFGIGKGAYTDWSATVAWKFFNARAYVSYLGTNLPAEGRCEAGKCGNRLVFGGSIGF